MPQPNTICKNVNCNKGENGNQAHYYVCLYCTKVQSWKAVACSEECYFAYMDQIEESRQKGKKVDTLPDRTDMTKEEIVDLFQSPMSEVIAKTREELADYSTDIEEIGVMRTVDKINEEMRTKNSQKKRFRRNNQKDILDTEL